MIQNILEKMGSSYPPKCKKALTCLGILYVFITLNTLPVTKKQNKLNPIQDKK